MHGLYPITIIPFPTTCIIFSPCPWKTGVTPIGGLNWLSNISMKKSVPCYNKKYKILSVNIFANNISINFIILYYIKLTYPCDNFILDDSPRRFDDHSLLNWHLRQPFILFPNINCWILITLIWSTTTPFDCHGPLEIFACIVPHFYRLLFLMLKVYKCFLSYIFPGPQFFHQMSQRISIYMYLTECLLKHHKHSHL